MGLDIDFYKVKDTSIVNKFISIQKKQKEYVDLIRKKYDSEYKKYAIEWDKWWSEKFSAKGNFSKKEPVIDFYTPEEDFNLSNNTITFNYYECLAYKNIGDSIDTLYMRKQNWMISFVEEKHQEYKVNGYIPNNTFIELTKSDIEDLIDRMTKITDSTGLDFTKNIRNSVYIRKKSIKLAEKLLPTCSGFFYGSISYDLDYFCQLWRYKNAFKEFMENDWKDDEHLLYYANW